MSNNMIGEQEIRRFKNLEMQDRIKRLDRIKKQQLAKHSSNIDRLHIVYVVRSMVLYGGVKIILEHAKNLSERGIKVSIVTHYPKPDWFNINVQYIEVPFGTELATGIPKCDVIVATSWHHISSCVEFGNAPVVMFEQGGSHMFEWENVDTKEKETIKKMYSLIENVLTVSTKAEEVIKNLYGINNIQIINNAIDENVFYPRKSFDMNENPYLLVVGSEQLEFKRIPNIISAYEIVKRRGYKLDFVWLTKDVPVEEYGTIHVMPPQETIGDLYRNATVFACDSMYESFCLPVLEAWACGCPVVTNQNIGLKDKCIDGVNCLITKEGEPEAIAEKIIELLNDHSLRKRIQQNGIETAQEFKWESIMHELIKYYKEIAQYKLCL